jgi:lysophospholipase L1-like esterase
MWLRIGLVVAGVVVALLAVETVLRVVDAVPEVANPLYSFHESDRRLGWRGKADVTLRFRRPQFDAVVAHDAAGWRAGDPPPPAVPARRVLVLGDSFTWGWGVAQGEVYTDHLQRRLPTTAIDNRGVNGFGTGQEYLLAQEELAARRYDVVLVQVFANDLGDNVDDKGGRRPLFQLDGDRLVPPQGELRPLQGAVRRWLKDHSRTFLLVDFTTRALGGGNAATAPVRPAAEVVAPVDYRAVRGGALIERLLRALAAAASEHGARPVILYAPHRLELQSAVAPVGVQAAHALAAEAARASGASFVDLTPPLAAAAARGEPVIFPGDEHWTPHGHRLAAEALLAAGVH